MEAYSLQDQNKMAVLRISTAGSVDDGKSTLIGRLLHDSDNVYEDHLASIAKNSSRLGESMALALLTDGLKAEREQGITIDVAYRYFSTPRRRFILADTPGHEQYTRNMATGASTADLSIVLIDAEKGVLTQTKRHAFIASLLGVPRLLIAVNKMDLVNYSQEIYQKIKNDFEEFSAKLGIKELRFLPISALQGDNVVHPSKRIPWYHGETLMEYLENVYVGADRNLVDFRFPVQLAFRPNQNYRGYAGPVLSGTIRLGEEVMVLPSLKKSRVKSIDYLSRDPKKRLLSEAFPPMSITLSLEDELDISRGDMLVRPKNLPQVASDMETMVVWMSETPMDLRKEYVLMHTTREVKAYIEQVHYKVDVNSLSRTGGEALKLNEIGRLSFALKSPLFVDPYQKNRATGNFIIVDPDTSQTVGAAMVVERVPQSLRTGVFKKKLDLHKEEGYISRKDREALFGTKTKTFWFTGLSGSGKSTLAKAFEQKMFKDGKPVYRLDGDNLRFGLNKDLGFSKEDRRENIRRVAEVAKLFNDAGITVICSFISPYISDRKMAQEIIGEESFIEVYLSTPIDVCETRDPHGLYEKARSGEIREFTGISAPYEAPSKPGVVIDTAVMNLEESVRVLENKIIPSLD